MLIRQGDLQLRLVGPAEGLPNPVVLSLATGSGGDHQHVLNGVMVRQLTTNPEDKGLLEVPADTTLRVVGTEWRHTPIAMPAGRYEFWLQRELSEDQEQEEIQRVDD